jgi:polysaccharide deacetylase 2 family uncharacterized protein YibQ
LRAKKPTRRRKSFKVTRTHIFVISILIVAVALGLLASLIHLYEPPKPHPGTNVTTPATEGNFMVNTTIIAPQVTSARPKLAIIIDDVTHQSQLNKIAAINLSITPSLLPPKKGSRTDELAKNLPFYMVHLPTEALSYNAEPISLMSGDDYAAIYAKLARFKQQFPRARYYNNHTGSRFTADLEAMQNLFIAMDELGLIFVDSRTTAQTKAPEVAQDLGKRLLSRDVFLDNDQDATKIREQLSLAVKKARERGYAIAIGHPHDVTLRTLRDSADLLGGIDVVYLKDI